MGVLAHESQPAVTQRSTVQLAAPSIVFVASGLDQHPKERLAHGAISRLCALRVLKSEADTLSETDRLASELAVVQILDYPRSLQHGLRVSGIYMELLTAVNQLQQGLGLLELTGFSWRSQRSTWCTISAPEPLEH